MASKKKSGENMTGLKHIGFVYEILLEGGRVLTWLFESEDEALEYCKVHYPNTVFQIAPIPVFKYIQGERKHGI